MEANMYFIIDTHSHYDIKNTLPFFRFASATLDLLVFFKYIIKIVVTKMYRSLRPIEHMIVFCKTQAIVTRMYELCIIVQTYQYASENEGAPLQCCIYQRHE